MSSITRKIADEIALHGSWEAYLKWDAAQSQEREAGTEPVVTDADIQKMKPEESDRLHKALLNVSCE